MNPELLDERALLREDLHAVVAAITDVHATVVRKMDAVEDVEFLDVWRRARRIVRRHPFVGDLREGNTLASPPALERTRVHVEHEDPFVDELGVCDIQLACVLVKIEPRDAADQHVGLLVVLDKRRRGLPPRNRRRNVAKVLEQLASATELQDGFATASSRYPHIAVAIDIDRLLPRPVRDVPGSAPSLNQVASRIEFEH